MSKNKNVGNLSLSTTVVARFLLFCAVLLALPAVAAAQCISQLTVQRVWTRDAAGNDKTTFAPGEAIQFAAELNNSYGGALLAANGTQLTITTSFYNDTKPVDIPPGISPWTWTATAPSTEGSYTVTVKAYDHFCGTFPEGSASFAVTSKPGGQLPSQIENPDPRLNSQPIFYPLGGTPPRAYDKLNPPPNAEHLVVIIHGWEPKGLEYDLSVENKMKSSIKKIIAEKRSSEKEKWYVKVWDWRSQAGPCIIDVDLSGLHLCANTAYSNATAQGEALSAEIGKYSFKDVHLIAHSAGSNVVQTAIDKLKGRPHLIFHATFLDAYAPSVDKLIYGIGANYAEHYVDKRGSIPWFSNTNQDLKNAYTFDVTALDETQFPPDYAIANPHLYLLYVHGWPTAWYQESIDSQGMESLIKFNYGFGLSRENGLDM